MSLRPAIPAGLLYFAAIFALGFVLGALRTLYLAPAIGPTAAVLCELPVMLAASWFAAKALVRRFGVRSESAALAMGGLAFALLMGAECALAVALGGTPRGWLGSLGTVPGAIGLAGQVAFALAPWAVERRG